MPTYFVSSPDRSDWVEEPAAFAAALRERWPDAEVREAPGDSTMGLYFEAGGASGGLDRGGQAVNVDGEPEVAARVAAWWRQRVPDAVTLVFYDEAFAADVPVEPGADAGALVSAYLAAVGV